MVLGAWFQNTANGTDEVKRRFDEAVVLTTSKLGLFNAHSFLVLQCLIVNAWGDATLSAMLNGADVSEQAGGFDLDIFPFPLHFDFCLQSSFF